MDSRLKLQAKLEELLGSRNVYYQPPASLHMTYPAIRYVRSDIKVNYADNTSYLMFDKYEITVIDRRPDNPVIKEILKLPHCGYDRQYKADNLYHDVLTIYL